MPSLYSCPHKCVPPRRVFLEEANARLQAALDGSSGDRDQLIQRIRQMEDEARRDKHQFEVCVRAYGYIFCACEHL